MSIKKSLLTLSLSVALTATAQAETFNFSDQAKKADAIVVFQAGDTPSAGLAQLNKQSNDQLMKSLSVAKFKGDSKQVVEVLAPAGIDADRVIVVGLGDSTELNAGAVNKIGASLSAKLSKTDAQDIQIFTKGISDNQSNASFAAELAHGISLRAYKFDKYLSKKKPAEKNYSLRVNQPQQAKTTYKQLEAVEAGVFLARDLTSEVPTEMNPVHFAAAAKELKKLGVKVKVLKPRQIKKLGMGALHAVGRGSAEGSRLVVAHWEGNNDTPIALVGKGITFDSGGYNVKTGKSIARMKSDMAGAAAVLGTVKALALQEADVNVVAVMAMAANMVSETSVAPGDVVETAEGLSVEILNTDAEGRLVVADGMWYARDKYKPEIMVDVATLTGSKVRALGDRYTAIFSEDDNLVSQLTVSGKAVDEKVWRLPLGYKDKLKSPIADLTNIGSGGPGATTAATFLQQFAGDTKWVHLDIAGNALISADKGVNPAGGTGHGVRLLSHWIMNNK
ncbi:leucyl aminopeptidase [Psychrobium sp. 1_MG-2023]|uniref:leucyl aminopeptidase n=1 Tax=Psychrobium sp. 1_MG-2023 TaxID=3062624 RepID=UPI000C33DA27|nr:leucyl aminopeptidase [Psychrobium sp. 1_MG-2023]MDP2562827.1 leucyl aminopeptidase [Psychrobium sp. 1_MG-2023]PKF57953.1 leucyl aminopeptidase [Alteromonadales bacterium alter-6D02]